jgi:hypothetical protein
MVSKVTVSFGSPSGDLPFRRFVGFGPCDVDGSLDEFAFVEDGAN